MFLSFFPYSTASAQTHKGINVQAFIKKPNGEPLVATGVAVKLQVLSPANCVLLEEAHSGVGISDGYMNLILGTGTRVGSDNGDTLAAVFENKTTRTGLDLWGTSVGSGGCNFTPDVSGQDARKLRISMTVDGDPIQADFSIRSTAYAIESERLEGKGSADFVQVNATKNVTQAKVEDFFEALTNGSSQGGVKWNGSNFVTYDPSSGSGLSANSVAGAAIASLPWSKLTSVPAGLTEIGGLSCVDGKILKRASGAWTCADDATGGGGGGSGTVTSVALGAPSGIFSVSGSPVTSSGTLSFTLDNQAAATVLAGPASGGAAAPAFRSLTISDIRSSNTGSFLNASGSCGVGEALTYLAPSDTIECASVGVTSSQVTTALGFTPVNKAGDTMTGALNITAGTKTSSAPIIDGTETWNSAGTVFTAAKLNVTDTASNASSLLLDLQVGGVSKFSVDKTGRVVGDGSGLTGVSGSATASGSGGDAQINNGSNALTATSDFNYNTTSHQLTLNTTNAPTGNALVVARAPAASGTKSLIRLGPNDIVSGNASGTYIGANPAAAAADFINYQLNGTPVFKVNSWGQVDFEAGFVAGGSYGQRFGVSDRGMAQTDIVGIDQDDQNTRALAIVNKTYYSTNGSRAMKLWQTDAGVGRISNAVAVDPAGISINTTGNVGIGTSSPQTALEVSGSSGGVLTLSSSATNVMTTNSIGGLEFYTNDDTVGAAGVGASIKAIAEDNGVAYGLELSTRNASLANSAFRIDSDGNVGIGTSDPNDFLHIYRPFGSASATIETGGAGDSTLALIQGGGSSWEITNHNLGNRLGFTLSGSSEAFSVSGTGSVGIGNTSPDARLDVTDTSTTTSAVIVPRAGNFTGTTVNGMVRYNTANNLFEFRQNGSWVNYTTVSDGRLKTNVTPVENGLDIVNQLRPVFYDWDRSNPRTKSFAKDHEVGFIAQEVEKVLPEVVDRGQDSYRSLQYGKIVAVVVAAIQELHQKFAGFERMIASVAETKADKAQVDERIQSLEAENTRLRSENASIKAWICSKDPQSALCK